MYSILQFTNGFNVLLIYLLTENIALRKPTYQQYQRTGISPELTDAKNAVDGLKTDLGLWGGQCVYSESNKHTATWWVNLTGIMSINHIMVYYMTGNVQWGTKLKILECR